MDTTSKVYENRLYERRRHNEKGDNMKIVQDVYWGLDDDDKIIIDEETIKREFEAKLELIVIQKTGRSEKEMK